MIVIGLLLLIAALIFGVDLVFANHHHIAGPAIFGQSLGLNNEAAVFVLGAITGAAILLALVLLASGIRHKGSKAVTHRRERREVKRTRGQRDELVSDNERLRSKLAEQEVDPPAPQDP